MAGLRISQLPAATAVASADLFPFSNVAESETRRITAGTLAVALGLLGTSVGSTAPLTPSNGQLWVDTGTNPPLLKVWNGATWTILSVQPGATIITSPGTTAPSSPALGQLWQDTSQTPDELKMWDGSNWVRVDPQGITQTAGDARYLQITTAASTYLALTGGTLTGNLTLPGVPTTTNMAATKGYVDTQIAAIPGSSDQTPSGTVIWTARTTAPTGYLKANGATVSRTTYATLFSAIGTTFGAGDGSTTFNVPDLRGEFARGWDDGRGIDTGRTFGSAQAGAIQSHNHTGSTATAGSHTHTIDAVGNHQHSTPQGTGAFVGYEQGNGFPIGDYALSRTSGEAGAHSHSMQTAGDHSHSFTTDSTGSTETRPRNIALLACIKT
jgi:microcystin-dependent protein